jgi:hypothetical protein
MSCTEDSATEQPTTIQPAIAAEDEANNANENPPKYRQYLIDRTNGKSKLGESKPPCSACFVPLPVLWFADYVEQNRLFEWLGRRGIFDASNLRARRIFIGLGLIANVLSAILSLYTCFSVSTHYNVIWATAFTSGFVNVANKTIYPASHGVRVGMRAIAMQTYYQTANNVIEEVITFDEFCELSSTLMDREDCGDCDAASGSMIFTLFISLIMCFPSITTSVLRLYPHYDCNCQKVFGGFAAIISVAFALYTFIIYQYRCFRSFGFANICIDGNGGIAGWQPSSPHCPQGYFGVQRNFHAGPGWIALATASGLKMLDMLFNLAIPTPTICRDKEEQRQYEMLVIDNTRVDDDDFLE